MAGATFGRDVPEIDQYVDHLWKCYGLWKRPGTAVFAQLFWRREENVNNLVLRPVRNSVLQTREYPCAAYATYHIQGGRHGSGAVRAVG